MKTIAIIGTGIMGRGIAANFLTHGYGVTIWNRTSEKTTDLVAMGAKAAPSPKDAVRQADIVVEVTANDESSRAVWLEADGILAGTRPGTILITCATLSVAWIDELARTCQERGLPFFDMPMTGGRQGAESGKLTLLAGGDKDMLEVVKPDLAAISADVKYFGPVGSGMRYKLLLNMLQGIHITALAEVLKVATAAGMDVKAVGDALAERPGGTTTNLTWRDYQNHPDPINFSVEWITKDLHYVKELAKQLDTPLLNDALKKYEEAIQRGLAEDDWTAVTRF